MSSENTQSSPPPAPSPATMPACIECFTTSGIHAKHCWRGRILAYITAPSAPLVDGAAGEQPEQDQPHEGSTMKSASPNQPQGLVPSRDATGAPVRLRRRLSHAEQIADRCVHFTGIGMGDGTCKAGVRYADVTRDHEPIAYRREDSSTTYRSSRSFPCLASHNLGGAVCDKRCAPTVEQVAAEEAESERTLTDILTARSGIAEQTKGKRGVSGTIICPRCLGTLHYSVAASNGHIHARCGTGGCLAWME